jgi:hypothetical protein
MRSITWKPGTDAYLDDLFDELREKRFQDRNHKLWKNYSREEISKYSGSIAYTICFDNNDHPEMCSTISQRDCWPQGAYRILNRLWKNSNLLNYPVVMSPSFGSSANSQVEWLKQNTNFRMYFISRQKDNWEKWCIRMFKKHYGLEFLTDDYKYLTCPNLCDSTCWQKIIFNGDPIVLEEWQRRTTKP